MVLLCIVVSYCKITFVCQLDEQIYINENDTANMFASKQLSEWE